MPQILNSMQSYNGFNGSVLANSGNGNLSWIVSTASNSHTYKQLPSPSKSEMESDYFKAIWNTIKTWDINTPEYSTGYNAANGSHVKLILDALIPMLRDQKINSICQR